MSDRENITDALDARFFAPLRRSRTRRVGVSLDVRDPRLRPLAFDGNFGLEREALRVTKDGHMAHTPHPFPADHPRIVRDFCENQTEINTHVWPTAEEAVTELKVLNVDILRVLGNGEWGTGNGERGMGNGERGMGRSCGRSPIRRR